MADLTLHAADPTAPLPAASAPSAASESAVQHAGVPSTENTSELPSSDQMGHAEFSDALSDAMNGDFASMNDWVFHSAVTNLIPAAIGLAVIFAAYFVAKYVSRIVSHPLRQRVDETLGRFIGTAIFYAIMAAVIGAVASKLGAPLGGAAAILAAAGFAIGLAFQGTLGNFAAGVLMIVFRPFKVGDVVSVAGVAGKVNEIDLFTTTLDTPDNRRLIIPNGSISSGTIENMSFHPHRRVEVVVGVDYDADLNMTRQALQTAVDTFAGETIQGEDRGNAVILASLGDSAVEWKVRVWVASADYWRLMELVTSQIKQQLDAVGIGIPYPQMDIHLNRVDSPESSSDSKISAPRPRMRPTRVGGETENVGQTQSGRLPFAS